MGSLKISVVIPVYNVEEYLGKCLNSVVNQTYRNLEIICVNDGSTDGSGQICDWFAAKDHRIIVIHKANGGVSSARNAALERCTGDYIGFVDGDDWLEPEMYGCLAKSVASSEADIDIAACGYYKDFGDSCQQVKSLLPVPEYPVSIDEFYKYVYIRDQYRGVAGYLCTRIIKRSIIHNYNLTLNEDIAACEDVLFLARCFLKSSRSVYTSIPLYHYVQRMTSVTHDAQNQLKSLDSCRAYQIVIDLYTENHIDETILDYVKRFYVYRAIKLLRFAFQYGATDKIAPLKDNIYKYFDIYCRTNSEYPERIEEVKRLLETPPASKTESCSL